MKVRERGKLCSVQKRRIADRTVVACPDAGYGRTGRMELAEDGLSCLMPDAAGNGHDKGGIPTSRVSEALACPCAVSGRSSGYGMSGGRGGVLCRPGGGSGWENPGQESAAGVRRAASVWEAAKAGVSTRRPRPKGMAARWSRMSRLCRHHYGAGFGVPATRGEYLPECAG